jgi:hypothetical protein
MLGAKCFKQTWKVGKVAKVGKLGREVGSLGKVGKVGKEGKEGTLRDSGCQLSTRFYSSLTKICCGTLEKV